MDDKIIGMVICLVIIVGCFLYVWKKQSKANKTPANSIRKARAIFGCMTQNCQQCLYDNYNDFPTVDQCQDPSGLPTSCQSCCNDFATNICQGLNMPYGEECFKTCAATP